MFTTTGINIMKVWLTIQLKTIKNCGRKVQKNDAEKCPRAATCGVVENRNWYCDGGEEWWWMVCEFWCVSFECELAPKLTEPTPVTSCTGFINYQLP